MPEAPLVLIVDDAPDNREAYAEYLRFRGFRTVEAATGTEAIEMARRLAKEEGILSGISCGAAVAVAVRLGKLPEFAGKTIVTVLPDAAERYLSTTLFEGMFDE